MSLAGDVTVVGEIDPQPPRYTGGRVMLAVLVLVVGGAFTWAFVRVFGTPAPVVIEAEHTFVAVGHGEVRSTTERDVGVRWLTNPVGTNRASGTVTAVLVEPGEWVDSGDMLYRVNERPVTLARGEIPSFRSMSRGVNGIDVAQLQTLLTELGHYTDGLDGVFGTAVHNAVRVWQRDMGVTDDGIVAIGDIVFVPDLPIRVVLTEAVIAVGRIVVGNEPVIGALPEVPTFQVLLTSSTDVSLVPPGIRVMVTGTVGGEEVAWETVAGQPGVSTTGQIVNLNSTDGSGSICEDVCDLVPIGGPTIMQGTIISVPLTAGLVVPVSALATDPGGGRAVIDETGSLVPVTVIASARGMAVVQGVAEGTKVRVPAGS